MDTMQGFNPRAEKPLRPRVGATYVYSAPLFGAARLDGVESGTIVRAVTVPGMGKTRAPYPWIHVADAETGEVLGMTTAHCLQRK